MNEIEIQSLSDKTSELPSVLREHLELNNDFDFISPEISPTARKSMAKVMGINTLNNNSSDMEVANIKQMLLSKLKELQPGDLDSIREENSEEFNMTEIDRTDCSYILRKSDSLSEGLNNTKHCSELIEKDDLCFHRTRTNSSIADNNEFLPIATQTDPFFFNSSKTQFQQFDKNEPINILNAVQNINFDIRTKDLKNDESLIRNKDAESRIQTEKEYDKYIDQIEKFKKKRKPEEILPTEGDFRLGDIQVDEIRRINLKIEEPAETNNTQKDTKKAKGPTSLQTLPTNHDSINSTSLEKYYEYNNLSDHSLLNDNIIYKSNDKFEAYDNNTFLSSCEFPKNEKFAEIKEFFQNKVKSFEIIYSKKYPQACCDHSKNNKLYKVIKNKGLNTSLQTYSKPRQKKKYKAHSLLKSAFLLGSDRQEAIQYKNLNNKKHDCILKMRSAERKYERLAKSIGVNVQYNKRFNNYKGKKENNNPTDIKKADNKLSKVDVSELKAVEDRLNGRKNRKQLCSKHGYMCKYNDNISHTFRSHHISTDNRINSDDANKLSSITSRRNLPTGYLNYNAITENRQQAKNIQNSNLKSIAPSYNLQQYANSLSSYDKTSNKNDISRSYHKSPIEKTEQGYDHIKMNKEKLKALKNINYSVYKSHACNLKIYSKAKELLKRSL